MFRLVANTVGKSNHIGRRLMITEMPMSTNHRRSSSHAVKAVIFDMGGVLVSAPKVAWQKYENQNNLQHNSVLSTVMAPELSGAFKDLETGKIGVPEYEKVFMDHYVKKFGAPANGRSIPLFSEFYGLVDPVPQFAEAIVALKERGLKLCLLTNNFWMDSQKSISCVAVDDKPFDLVIESCKVGLRKPNTAIYQMALDGLQTQPENTVFLDDLGNNLKPAAAMGMGTIKVENADKAIDELEQRVGFPLRGFAPGTMPVKKDMQIDMENLMQYLADKCGIRGNQIILRQFTHGHSNPTYYFSVDNQKYVLRKKPPGKLLQSAHMIEREYKVMSAVRNQGVPTPKLVHYCEDDSVIGTNFYLMDYVPGRIFKDPELIGFSPDQKRRLYAAMTRALASIHQVDLTAAGLQDYGKHGEYIKRQLSRWTKQYELSKTHEIPAMNNLIKWLNEHIPPTEETTLVHGDFRLDNLIFDPVEDKVIGVLDWELSTLGNPLTDLSSSAFAHYIPPDFPILKGISHLKLDGSTGIPSPTDCVNAYAQLRGLNAGDIQTRWNFYVAFTFFRFAAILQGVYKRAQQGKFPCVPEAMSPRARRLYEGVRDFVRNEVIPKEMELIRHSNSTDCWTPHPIIDELKAKAKAKGLWNLFIPEHVDPKGVYGAGLTNVEYSHMCELMGYNIYAPEVFNCSAPDTGNMEVLIKYGTPEQKRKWLTPLLDGTKRSCFAMTEPAVASSDATNIESSIVRRGSDSYVLNGRKWYISGAMHPDCDICIFMGKTDTSAPRHRQQSMILVDMKSPGIEIVRAVGALGYLDPPAGHAEIIFKDVVVPAENLLLGEGRGFEIAQGRLGPGRIHHCMRLLGNCERAMELFKDRVQTRVAFGAPLATKGSIQFDIAHSRMEIEQARLLVLKTAHIIDELGNKDAANEIAMIKVITPNVALRVIDRAIQAHGAMGLSQDTILSAMYVWARCLRLADGPDEVHTQAIAKSELRSKI